MAYDQVKRGMLITLVYSLSAVLMRGFNFLVLPYCMTMLSLTDFGIWDFSQFLFVRLSIVLTSLGICSLQRFYFLYQKDQIKQQQVIGNSLLLLICPLLLGLFLYSAFWGAKGGDFFCHLMGGITFLYCIFAYLSAYVRIKEYIVHYLILLFMQNGIASFGCVLGLYYGYGVQSFFLATLASLIVLVPYFMYIGIKHFHYSYGLLKEQFSYAMPLMLYNVLYISFFFVDRLILKWYGAYELMGIYGILWRFGSIFQVFTMALVAAWPNILFSFAHEHNDTIVKNLIVYNASFICFLCLMTMSISHGLFVFYLPHDTHVLMLYVPLFFLSLTFFELARLFQTAFLIVQQTRIVPLITVAVLGMQLIMQIGCIWWRGAVDLWCFLAVNCISCMVYAFAFFYNGQKIYRLIDHRMVRILLLFLLGVACIQGAILCKSIALSFGIASLWIVVVYYDIRSELRSLFVKVRNRLLPS